jgi:hypothetical protein
VGNNNVVIFVHLYREKILFHIIYSSAIRFDSGIN